jgi:tRNA modification GTPase
VSDGSDTIAAIATGHAAGGIGIVRLSGSRALAIGKALTGRTLRTRRASAVRFRDGAGRTLDHGLALAFRAPRSFTGEEVVELHAHGSPVVLRALLARCLELGARVARPGEFSERAFLNGKLDLAQAEAVADLIAAGSEAQMRAALRSLEGAFSARVHALLDALVRLRMHAEAAIDFPEEEIDFLSDRRIHDALEALVAEVAATLAEARRGQRLRDGLHVVIIGAPNAGKSSLMNALAGDERAIVTAIPGTTRDLLREAIVVDGVELTLVDTAGLRATDDPVEREGVARARRELARADLALLVVDASEEPAQQAAARAALGAAAASAAARIWLLNKIDRVPGDYPFAEAHATAASGDALELPISARTGTGLERLRRELHARAAGGADAGTFSARARHVAALEQVAQHLARGRDALLAARAGELLAEELRQAQQALGEITGAFTTDDLLGRIFAEFCIGK